MAKLDQDNKLLAELDEKVLLNQKIRQTANPPFKSSSLAQTNSLLANAAAAAQLHSSLPSLNQVNQPASNLLNLSSLASKNLLSALEASDLTAASYPGLAGLNTSNLVTNLGASNLLGQTSLSSLSNRQALSQPTLNATSALTSALNNVANQQKQLQNQIQHQIQQQQQLLNSNLTSANLHAAAAAAAAAATSSIAANQPPPAQSSLPAHDHRANEIRIAEDIVDSIEIANRGRFRVFIARYSYDPFKQSPNEHPEAELHLNAGDFLLVQVFLGTFKI